MTREKRDAEIIDRHLAGERLNEIGPDYGITRERVRQIVRAAGVTEEESREAYHHACMVTATCEGCGAQIHHHYSKVEGKPTYCHVGCARKYDEEHLLRHLSALAKRLGRTPRTVDLMKISPPGHVVYFERFGSLRKAQELAGLTPNPRGGGRRQYTDDELLDHLRALGQTLNHTPTTSDIRKHSPPTPATYQRRFGSMRRAQQRAGMKPNDPGCKASLPDDFNAPESNP